MAANQQHTIEQLVFDVSFASKRHARKENAHLNHWIATELLPELDNVLNHYASGRPVLRFEKLEFDLGTLSYKNYQNEITQKLTVYLEDILKKHVLPDNSQNNSGGYPENNIEPDLGNIDSDKGIISSNAVNNLLPALLGFLREGTLEIYGKHGELYGKLHGKPNEPYHRSKEAYEKPGFQTHEQLLLHVIKFHPVELVSALRSMQDKQTLIHRLINQFSDASLVQLMGLLAAENIAIVVAAMDLFYLTVNRVGRQQENSKYFFNEILLNNLLDTKKSNSNKNTWTKNLFIDIVSSTFVKNNPAISRELIVACQSWQDKKTMHGELARIVLSLDAFSLGVLSSTSNFSSQQNNFIKENASASLHEIKNINSDLSIDDSVDKIFSPDYEKEIKFNAVNNIPQIDMQGTQQKEIISQQRKQELNSLRIFNEIQKIGQGILQSNRKLIGQEKLPASGDAKPLRSKSELKTLLESADVDVIFNGLLSEIPDLTSEEKTNIILTIKNHLLTNAEKASIYAGLLQILLSSKVGLLQKKKQLKAFVQNVKIPASTLEHFPVHSPSDFRVAFNNRNTERLVSLDLSNEKFSSQLQQLHKTVVNVATGKDIQTTSTVESQLAMLSQNAQQERIQQEKLPGENIDDMTQDGFVESWTTESSSQADMQTDYSQWDQQRIIYKFAESLLKGDVVTFNALWNILSQLNSDSLSQTLAHYIKQAEVRQQIAIYFPLHYIDKIINNVSVDVFTWLQHFIDIGISSITTNPESEESDVDIREIYEITLNLLTYELSHLSSFDDYIVKVVEIYADNNHIDLQIMNRLLAILNKPVFGDEQDSAENKITEAQENEIENFSFKEKSRTVNPGEVTNGESSEISSDSSYPEDLVYSKNITAEQLSDNTKQFVEKANLHNKSMELPDGNNITPESKTIENNSKDIHVDSLKGIQRRSENTKEENAAEKYSIEKELIEKKLIESELIERELIESKLIKNVTAEKYTVTETSHTIDTHWLKQKLISVLGQAANEATFEQLFKTGSPNNIKLFYKRLALENIEKHSTDIAEQEWVLLLEKYIEVSDDIASSFKQDFLQSIFKKADSYTHKTTFYANVFAQLIQQKNMDFDALDEVMSAKKAILSPVDYAALVAELYSGSMDIEQLVLDASIARNLFIRVLQKNNEIDSVYREDFSIAVQHQASLINDAPGFYAAVISKILRKEAVDLPLLAQPYDALQNGIDHNIQQEGISGLDLQHELLVQQLPVQLMPTNSLPENRLSEKQETEIQKTDNQEAESKKIEGYKIESPVSLNQVPVNQVPVNQVSVNKISIDQHSVPQASVLQIPIQPSIQSSVQTSPVQQPSERPLLEQQDHTTNNNTHLSNINIAIKHRSADQNIQLFSDLLQHPSLTTVQQQQLQSLIEFFLQQNSSQEWRSMVAHKSIINGLVEYLPAYVLNKILLIIEPDRFDALKPIMKIISDALSLLTPQANSDLLRKLKWEFIFHYLLLGNKAIAITDVVFELADLLVEQNIIKDAQLLVNLTQRRVALLTPSVKPALTANPYTNNSKASENNNVTAIHSGLPILNAGQVLAAPYLPRLFSMLNLTANGKFVAHGAAERAVHLLQYMVTGQAETPEYELVLNKILCGISTSIPVCASIDITENEKNIIEQMLNSMIQHWTILGSTSIAGLRETFLRRQGWLSLEDDAWRLQVQKGTFDMLLDQLPWGFSIIKYGWMDKPVNVSWRN